MNTIRIKQLAGVTLALVGVAGLAACATGPSPAELDRQATAMMKASFRDQGIAKVDRLNQDPANEACSQAGTGSPAEALVKSIEAANLATVKAPSDGQFLGDWKAGERLAQSGRGMTWTDPTADAKDNGGNCYNCHQISKEEISHGTIGPSLYQYGKLRGVANPASAESKPIVEYTWGKLWNARAYNACSHMPRFGHKGLLDEKQLKDIMALLLDPKSPVNQ
ncbi:sulfur oxidation c-type cytochrome SoxX [Sphaerotilus mobilis]|uniref:Monoheme cytochrome SoxX (Sulfur oxidation) n=1 Tax=Sphaerotilus mobilis TaxID=47994 RepID=A0A4Q7LIU6_9BURK|nr:sulfur oxidation c-type cytochrome SoxX [Sphaerotilus mobilis]RZS54475.1 monoheme cytochrome SoxX (sulfur oxidation) [Sphaerotilus mobilis]